MKAPQYGALAEQVPVIMLTRRGKPADRVVGLEPGTDDYIVKPLTSANWWRGQSSSAYDRSIDLREAAPNAAAC